MKGKRKFLFLLATSILLWSHLPQARATSHTNIQTVFIILLENVSWPDIAGSANAPFINQVLIPQSSYCNNMYIVPNTFGSLPQYLWLESGTNWGVSTDSNDPASHHFNTTNHLVVQLQNAGITWKAYQESISGTACPTASSGLYAAFHNPFVYFDDVYLSSTNCTNHIRPYTELGRDLTNNTVARYNFITPNLCNCMHGGTGCPAENRILTGDKWLAQEIPKITNSAAYKDRGAIIITWDEGTGNVGGPFGTIVLSQFAKGGGYRNTNRLDHTATFRTLQEIFGVPFLFAAKNAASLSDLFKPAINVSATLGSNGAFQLIASGIVPGKTNYLQFASNLANGGTWVNLATNVVNTNRFIFRDTNAGSFPQRFYRLLEAF
ncbi:MAG TPA: alkaline phosphatase family protein [Candidatus Saccharimonadales bacterium]|nr:alkaline phosphatase family protein [Candidatus Saccharimonadales bacterium]